VLESDCLEHVGLDLFKQIPDVKFMIDIKDDNTDKSQFIVHHNDAPNLDFRYGSGVYDKSAPHGILTGYIPGFKQSEKVAKYMEIRNYAYKKSPATCGITLYRTIKESIQSANKLTTTYEYLAINNVSAKLLAEHDDITDLSIIITMKWNKIKYTDFEPDSILEALEIGGACDISIVSASVYPFTDNLKEQVTQIEFDSCNYNIKSFLNKSTFMSNIFKVLRSPPFRADEISYIIRQKLHIAIQDESANKQFKYIPSI
jgi:hypothetical protein